MWDTRLVRGDTEVEATKIESLHNDPAVVEVLPYVDRFDDVYIVSELMDTDLHQIIVRRPCLPQPSPRALARCAAAPHAAV